MNIKINPKKALEKLDDFIERIDDLLTKSYNEGNEEKSELTTRIKQFIRYTFKDAEEKIQDFPYAPISGYLEYEESNEEKQLNYVSILKKIKNLLISLKEEIEISMGSEISQETITELNKLNKDLDILIQTCENDIDKDASISYKLYVNEYNDIISKLQEMNSEFKTFHKIDFELAATYMQSLPPHEQAKLKEIIKEAKKLSHRIQKITGKESNKNDVIFDLEMIFSRFNSVIHQLKHRYNNRATLKVDDEYDVQDLLHAILKIFFEDIRPEEPTPSYAGGHRKMDFLLKSERTVIEVKMTRESLSANELSKQLNDDVATYKNHADSDTLVCFIYDPSSRIENPVGFENDFVKNSTNDFKVLVYIYPKY